MRAYLLAVVLLRSCPADLAPLHNLPERVAGLCGDGPAASTDLASYWLVSLWHGFDGPISQDLSSLREIGVQARFLHHCRVPAELVKEFLDKAWMSGLTVIPELQPRLFFEHGSGCFTTGFDCYETLRSGYRELLEQGSLWEDGAYHPAVQMLILMQDPVPHAAGFCGNAESCSISSALLGVVSAWDGLLAAEAELGLARPVDLGLTVLFPSAAAGGNVSSKEECFRQKFSHGGCAGTHILRQVYQAAFQTPGWQRNLEIPTLIRRGIQDGVYVPHNDLVASMVERWTHVFDVKSSNKDGIIESLRQYEEFVPDPVETRVELPKMLLQLNNSYV